MRKERAREESARAEAVSYLDINQVELAFINRALRSSGRPKIPDFVKIGKSKRILLLQKRNLETLCRRLKKNCREGALEGELRGILGGAKAASIRFMAPMS